jgi:hypothetical protein
MPVISSLRIELSVEEQEILLELLDHERANLPIEIHHTRTAKFRDYLKHRLEVVESLFRRLSNE